MRTDELKMINDIKEIFTDKISPYDNKLINELINQSNTERLSHIIFNKTINNAIEFKFTGDVKDMINNNGFYGSEFNTSVDHSNIIYKLDKILTSYNKSYEIIDDSTILIKNN